MQHRPKVILDAFDIPDGNTAQFALRSCSRGTTGRSMVIDSSARVI